MTPARTAALELVNRYREAMGMARIADFPKGRKLNAFECPVKRALDALFATACTAGFRTFTEAYMAAKEWQGTSAVALEIGSPGPTVPMPADVADLIYEFDMGKHPDLESA